MKHIIFQDTREQRPLVFFHYDFKTVVCTIKAGDYHVQFSDNSFSNVVFERKSIPDLFGTLTSGYERFRREILKIKANKLKLIIVIEGTLKEVFEGCRFSKVQGAAIVKTLFSLWVRHGIVPVFTNDRDEASEFIIQYYLAEWRKRQEKKNG